MSPQITTYSGKHFDITHPNPEAICIEDIAHALSLICRGNGHVTTFLFRWPALPAMCQGARARNLPSHLVLAALLHDATECYMSDVPRPMKQLMPIYRQTEARLLDVIYEKFLGQPLTAEETRLLKDIDNAFLWYDLTYLLQDKPDSAPPQVYCVPDYRPRPLPTLKTNICSTIILVRREPHGNSHRHWCFVRIGKGIREIIG